MSRTPASDPRAREDESLEQFIRRLNRDFLGGGDVRLQAALERMGPPPSDIDDGEDFLVQALTVGI